MTDIAKSQDTPTTPGAAANGANGTASASAPGPRQKWNVSGLKSSYVNFANANSTREEVVLNFGMNAAWDRANASSDTEIELAHRIVMSPFAAKRLSDLLVRMMAEYEARYGALK